MIMAVRSRKSDIWPASDGLIEALMEVRSVGNHGPYYGMLSYSYEVADEYYSGEWMTPSFSKRSDVNEFSEKQMPKGTKVMVKYDPGIRRGACSKSISQSLTLPRRSRLASRARR